MRKISILAILFIYVYSINSQSFIPSDFNNYFFVPKNMGLSSPQVSDFIKYGNLDINYYKGLLDMEIPLEGYKDNDFDIPISIKYISTGFIPSKRPSLVGYNWILNFGGVITRKVNGSPDDTRGYYTGKSQNLDKYLKDGYLVSIRDNIFKEYSEEELLRFDIPKNKTGKETPYGNGDFKYDMEPDIFNFSFGKHQGSFIIDNSGKVTLLSGDNQYKINIDYLSIQSYNTTEEPVPSSIEITTSDGFVYEFGGDTNYLEYFIPNNPKDVSVRPRYITSWVIKSIRSPNQRTVKFKYKSTLQPYKYSSFVYSFNTTTIHPPCSNNNQRTAGNSNQIDFVDNIYTPIVECVEVDNKLALSFEINDQNHFYDDDDVYSKSLSSIKYYYADDQLKKTDLMYEQKDSYFFLRALKCSNGGKYEFKYNLETKLPNPKTISLDHWGFWAGKNITKVNNSAVFLLNIEENRKVDVNYSDVALLKKIIYPTQGYTEIEYESNYYNTYHSKNESEININMHKVKNSIPAGGARVKSIKDYDPNRNKSTLVRHFKYVDLDTNIGSGVIGLEPRYRIEERISGPYSESGCKSAQYITSYLDISANSFGLIDLYGEYHVGYAKVIEYFDDGSFNYYNYTSHNGTSDKNDITYYIKDNRLIDTSLNDIGIADKHNLYITNDFSKARGKLRSKLVYDSTKTIKQISRYEYNFNEIIESYNISLKASAYGFASYKIYLKPCLLMKEEIIRDNLKTTLNYTYDTQNQISIYETINSNGDNYKIIYKYPYDNETEVSKTMVKHNVISPILQKVKYINDSEVSRIKNTYISVLRGKLGGRLPNYSFLQTKVETSTSGESTLRIEESYNSYDDYGNLLQITSKDGMPIVYLWSYKGRYLVAEIKNATYEEVENTLGFGIINTSLYIPFSPDMNKIDALREKLPNAQITTYTYKPLIGMETMTDPRGVITHYDYDGFGRLKEVYIKETSTSPKRVIESYDYKYANQ